MTNNGEKERTTSWVFRNRSFNELSRKIVARWTVGTHLSPKPKCTRADVRRELPLFRYENEDETFLGRRINGDERDSGFKPRNHGATTPGMKRNCRMGKKRTPPRSETRDDFDLAFYCTKPPLPDFVRNEALPFTSRTPSIAAIFGKIPTGTPRIRGRVRRVWGVTSDFRFVSKTE